MTVKERLKQRQEALKAKKATDSAGGSSVGGGSASDANSSGSVDDNTVQPFESP